MGDELRERKAVMRRAAHARRAAQPDKGDVSQRIAERLLSMPVWERRPRVLVYLDVRDEVRTRFLLPRLWERSPQVVVPYCVGQTLELFRLESTDELAEGRFGILEPRAEWRAVAEKRVDPATLDLLLIPGVAFDRRGGRLGHGQGFYDRLLSEVRADALRVGLAYECQLVDAIPLELHDVPMHHVVTEAAIYPESSD